MSEAQKGLSDLEALQMRANAVTDESLESTRRMMAMCEEVQCFFFPIQGYLFFENNFPQFLKYHLFVCVKHFGFEGKRGEGKCLMIFQNIYLCINNNNVI